MRRFFLANLVALLCVTGIYAQTVVELADDSSIPAVIRALPDWESVFDKAVRAKNPAPLKSELGDREYIDLIDFTGGTEAVTAPYDEGRLLLIEYPTPQASVAADAIFNERLAATPSNTVYRRIGNYNVFLFDAPDAAAANQLLDRIKYEKTVQWLGKDPNEARKHERYLATATADLFISTVIAIVLGFAGAIVTGVVTGYVFFRMREQRRAAMPAYSDAGGMVRLNLDDLTSPVKDDRFLNQ